MTNYQTLTFELTKKVSIGMPVYNVADYISTLRANAFALSGMVKIKVWGA